MSSFLKVKLVARGNPPRKWTANPLKEFARITNINPVNIKDSTDGYTVIIHVNDITEIYKIFQKPYRTRFEDLNLEPRKTSDLRAKATLIVILLDSRLARTNSEYLRSNVRLPNSLHCKPLNPIKLSNTTDPPRIYIELEDHKQALEAVKAGIVLDNWYVPPSLLRIQQNVTVLQCYKCYAIGKHQTWQCLTKEQRCSLCPGRHHHCVCTHYGQPFCRNCRAYGHTAVEVGRCPELKKAVATKRRKLGYDIKPVSNILNRFDAKNPNKRYSVRDSWRSPATPHVTNPQYQHHQVNNYRGRTYAQHLDVPQIERLHNIGHNKHKIL